MMREKSRVKAESRNEEEDHQRNFYRFNILMNKLA